MHKEVAENATACRDEGAAARHMVEMREAKMIENAEFTIPYLGSQLAKRWIEVALEGNIQRDPFFTCEVDQSSRRCAVRCERLLTKNGAPEGEHGGEIVRMMSRGRGDERGCR